MLEFIEKLKKQKEQLQNAGAENIKGYTLVNNSGYTFNKNGIYYDLRHWINCYGVEVDYYELSIRNSYKKFMTFEQAIDYIAMI